MKLYLIRHGQTQWNIDGKIQGTTDVPLNDTGLWQARLLAGAMVKHPVAALFSSPLKRAYQTAEVVALAQSLPVYPVEELKEVDFGLWEGLTWEEIDRQYHEDFVKWDGSPADHTPTGGESRENCRSRCKAAVERILAEADEAGGDAAIVAHGGILVFVVDYLLRNQKEKKEIIVKNASITTVEYDRAKELGTLLRLNDVSHLENGPGHIINGQKNRYC